MSVFAPPLPFLYRACLVAQRVKHLPQCRKPRFDSWVGKIPWRRKQKPTLVTLPGKSYGWRSLVGYSPLGRKESDTTEQLHFHFTFLTYFTPNVSYMVTNSSFLKLKEEFRCAHDTYQTFVFILQCYFFPYLINSIIPNSTVF